MFNLIHLLKLLFCVGEFFGEKPEDNVQIDKILEDPSSSKISL